MMPSGSLQVDGGQKRDRPALVLLGLLFMLIVVALFLFGGLRHDAGFWLWLDPVQR